MRRLALVGIGVLVVLATASARGVVRATRPPAAQAGPGEAAPPQEPGLIAWQDMTEADWVYSLATRLASVEGHEIHYPTPTAELAEALAARPEPAAQRHLAEARLELGDRAGAVAALERWAEATGAAAWAEAARWGASHLEPALAFRAAERALSGLAAEQKRALATERIGWAERHPEAGDALALRKARAELFPDDAAFLEEWIRALEAAGRLDEAEAALGTAAALSPERRLLIRSDLLADHNRPRPAFDALDTAVEQPWSQAFRKAYAERTDAGHPTAPESWRSTLDRRFDAGALLRLATYFEGQGRGDAAAELLRQVERRHEAGLDRAGFLLLARLWGEIDAVPEAFRARLAAAQLGGADERTADLAELARLALRAGSRALPWGRYNDEPYRWIARLDRTPGFWTGGLSFLLTGEDWGQALRRLESESLAERTFATARLLEAELARRAPEHPERPALRVGLMQRFVERGEGQAALEMLPSLETAAPDVADAARRVALLAMKQVEVPLPEERRLYRARLRVLAPDGSQPEMQPASDASYDWSESWQPRERGSWRRVPRAEAQDTYSQVLDAALARLEQRDPSHRASLELLLGEMDRMPDAEPLWEELAERLESWSLDDELGPRYERALQRFSGAGWWNRAARWYARRSRQADLRRLAEEIAARFRGAALFARAQDAPIGLEIAEQPPAEGRARLVPWADWVRLKALERFPHNPTVFKQALGRMLVRSRAAQGQERIVGRPATGAVVVDDDLLERRRWALLYSDPERREEYFAAAMGRGELAARLRELESLSTRTPVEELLLFEGWSRLSRFESAAPAGDRLAAAYPGDGALARRLLSLHRSLAALDAGHAAPARALVGRVAPALLDPAPLWTELGELEQEAGRPEAALATWRNLVAGDPRDPERVSSLATLLWDYGQMPEALAALEQGRTLMRRPRFMAFEAGVLREEVHDLDGAIREYLASLEPEQGDCFCSYFEHDQRSLRRLAQLLGRVRVRGRVVARIEALRPGVRDDEQVLASLFPLASIELPDRVADWDADDWIDTMDLPHDPVGREQRAEQQEAGRPLWREGIAAAGDALHAKALAMVAQGSETAFLDAASGFLSSLPEERRPEAREVEFRAALLLRRAELAPTPEARVELEVERARFLAEKGRVAEADAAWVALLPRLGTLPEGAPRLRAEAQRAAYLERTHGADAAAAEWARLGARYAWSLGLLEDRLAFLARNGRGEEARGLLEAAATRAAAGHREALLERLAREAIEARDLARARRAVLGLLSSPLADDRRLGAVHLLARLSLRESPGFDPLSLAPAEEKRLAQAEHVPDLYAQLARAAVAEKQPAPAVRAFVEAINRRVERAWLHEAARAARRAGTLGELVAFYEKQRERSPRDVRWAVAVRELRLEAQDLEGAIEMARAAVAVRPERESLWREASDLLVRAGRPRDAADFVEGWGRPRPGDESVAEWRGGLYARAGDAQRALAVEREALEAFREQAGDDPEQAEELRERTARAARRLRGFGEPKLAWALLSPRDDVKAIASSPLGDEEQAGLALATGNFVRLLRQRAASEDFRSAAARALADNGSFEQREEALAFVTSRLFPARKSAAPAAAAPAGTAASGRASLQQAPWPGNQEALRTWWSFAERAGLEDALRLSLARRYVASVGGPWQQDPGVAFLEDVARVVTGWTPGGLRFESPDIEAFWVRDLVRQDRDADLVAFLEPRVQDLLAGVRGGSVLTPKTPRLAWSSWLDDKAAFAAWVRGLEAQPARLAELGALFSDRRSWDRLFVLAARGWDVSPLVTALPEDTRVAWFRLWQVPSPIDPDPTLRARGQSLEAASRAVTRLVTGAAGAAADPLLAKLRGPRTVGELLGSDPAWTWPEFTPRRSASGELLEQGEERVFGQRADAGRLPGALWGERPGQAWYVLETLARLRERDAEAPLVPLEQPQRGAASARAGLAMRVAEALGDPALAVALDEQHPPGAADLARLGIRLRLALAAGQRERAAQLFDAELRRTQDSLGEGSFRALRRLADDLGLPDPLERLDPALPVAPGLLAFVCDRFGPEAAARFEPKDRVDYRAALAARWRSERDLDAPRVRYALHELWATGGAPLPRTGLRRLGGLWPRAADWLERTPLEDRPAAVEAIEALPDAARLLALLDRPGAPADEVSSLLRLRVHLLRGEDAAALALASSLLDQVNRPDALLLAPAAIETPEDEEPEAAQGEEADWEPEHEPASSEAPADAFAARLGAWLAPFRDAQRVDLVASRFRAALTERRDERGFSVVAFLLELELTPEAERAPLLAALERAFLRGELGIDDPAALAEALATRAPAEAARWLGRWTPVWDFEHVARRARLMVRLGDRPGALHALLAGRQRGVFTSAEEVRAFDLWRLHAPEPAARAVAGVAAPGAWTRALPFWRRKPGEIGADMGRHLREHPLDLLAARAVLRSVGPGAEPGLRLAARVLQGRVLEAIGDPAGDQLLVRLRLGRGLLPASRRAARASAGALGGAELARTLDARRFRRADVSDALADVARLADPGSQRDEVLSALEDRDPPRARALRAELRAAEAPRPPRPFRLQDGTPAALRPRDLDWTVLTAVLDAEGPR